MNNETPTILGIDPGTRFLGTAVIRGSELLDFGVHQLRNGEQPHELMDHGQQVLFALIRDFAPRVVAIEAPYLIATKRAAVLTTFAQVLHRRSEELGLEVVEQSPETARKVVAGDPKAGKVRIAETLAQRFLQLAPLVPQVPKIPALWLTSKERYWLHMFDALALAVSAGQTSLVSK